MTLNQSCRRHGRYNLTVSPEKRLFAESRKQSIQQSAVLLLFLRKFMCRIQIYLLTIQTIIVASKRKNDVYFILRKTLLYYAHYDTSYLKHILREGNIYFPYRRSATISSQKLTSHFVAAIPRYCPRIDKASAGFTVSAFFIGPRNVTRLLLSHTMQHVTGELPILRASGYLISKMEYLNIFRPGAFAILYMLSLKMYNIMWHLMCCLTASHRARFFFLFSSCKQ